MEKNLWKHILHVKQQSPLVHNITNYVVMNNTANALLAAGASPIMAHAKSEMYDMVRLAHALVINIGTLDEYWAESMLIAAKEAKLNKTPWVLDPVGAGATPYRDQVLSLLITYSPTVIRGNASEIIALAKANKTATKGVDSTATSNEAIEAARSIHNQYGCMVCVSGETDIIIDEERAVMINNGHPLMTKVTGLGCSASALIGAFIGIIPNKIEAVAAAMALLSVAGELAEQESNGPGSLQMNLLDKLYNIREEEFLTRVKITH